MEYVAGEPLNTSWPGIRSGLPRELAREWFLGLARAVAYLHDHGIVHRDLKPGNIFLENGVVKVGDYGLCKSIGTSQRTAQTQSVGTVHYMAPEISTGNYNKQIDIYAAGIILYEMLTGRVPFEGESAGEILMKHLTTPPDLSKVPAEYVADRAEGPGQEPGPALRAAWPRWPAPSRRWAFSPPACRPRRPPHSLGAPLRRPVHPVPGTRPDGAAGRVAPRSVDGTVRLDAAVRAVHGRWAPSCGRPSVRDDSLTELSTVFFLTVAACWAVLVPSKFWTERRGDSWLRRFALLFVGGLVGLRRLVARRLVGRPGSRSIGTPSGIRSWLSCRRRA